MTAAPPPTVLVVCTGNVCRSPLLERLLQREVDAAHGAGAVAVRSAGTRALVGSAMDDRSAQLLRRLGGDPEGFAARSLTDQVVAGADLVLTATPEHRSDVVRLDPRALRRTFTVHEFAALADAVPARDRPGWEDPAEALAGLARSARAQRGTVGRPSSSGLVDPYRRSDEVYAALEQQVREVLPALARALGQG